MNVHIGITGRLTVLSILLGGCSVTAPPHLQSPPRSLVVTSGGNHSASYLARVEGGIIVVDLGWWGADDALENGLKQLGATPEDVVAVFLTHSHRDHIAGWRRVRHAPFHMARSEVELLFRRSEHGGWIPRWAEKLMRSDVPATDDVRVGAFASDTVFVMGSDTMRAFLMPGHTAGSAAYLFRGTLFVGDAVGSELGGGWRPARGGYSDDVEAARRSLTRLRERVARYDVRWMCSAHLKCGEVTDALWADLLER
jgi:glyoxylase-like metal-dependent hydrolase (beta-lactamase superfamily II)